MAYQKEGFGDRKTFIRRKYYCPDNYCKHNRLVMLEKYGEKTRNKIRRSLYICPECRNLFFKSATHCVPMYIGNESILISNIDSPNNNSIPCPNCHKTAVRCNNHTESGEYYFCNDCYTFIKHSEGEWYPNISKMDVK